MEDLHPTRKLGRLPSPHDDRTLRIEKYFTPQLPAPPASIDWGQKVPRWSMAGNDRYGDCVFASKRHAVALWTANESTIREIPDAEVVSAYFAFTGNRDVGANILEVLKHWRKAGLWGNNLWAYGSLEIANTEAIKQGIALFGAISLGLTMLAGWLNTEEGDTWDLGMGRQSGGHDVAAIGYSDAGLEIVTWGGTRTLTWRALRSQCDEAWAQLNPEWIAQDAVAPSGLKLDQLHADLFAISQG